jgi:hypothetical protein
MITSPYIYKKNNTIYLPGGFDTTNADGAGSSAQKYRKFEFMKKDNRTIVFNISDIILVVNKYVCCTCSLSLFWWRWWWIGFCVFILVLTVLALIVLALVVFTLVLILILALIQLDYIVVLDIRNREINCI